MDEIPESLHSICIYQNTVHIFPCGLQLQPLKPQWRQITGNCSVLKIPTQKLRILLLTCRVPVILITIIFLIFFATNYQYNNNYNDNNNIIHELVCTTEATTMHKIILSFPKYWWNKVYFVGFGGILIHSLVQDNPQWIFKIKYCAIHPPINEVHLSFIYFIHSSTSSTSTFIIYIIHLYIIHLL